MVREIKRLVGGLEDRQISYLQCLIDGESMKGIGARASVYPGTLDKFEEGISWRLGESCAEVGLAKAVRNLVWDKRLDTSNLPQELPGLNVEEQKLFFGLFGLKTVEEISLFQPGAEEILRGLLRRMSLKNQYQLVAVGAVVAQRHLAAKAS